MGFSRQEYYCGLPFPYPGDLPDPEIEPSLPAWQADSLPSEPLGKRQKIIENFLNVELQTVLKIMLPNMCFHEIINSVGH